MKIDTGSNQENGKRVEDLKMTQKAKNPMGFEETEKKLKTKKADKDKE
ncbi:MAG: hypothetical protein ACLVI9_00800 [Anaerostipes hadrus]